MSTIGTQLNWGSSYLVNDFYKRFLVRGASEKHYVNIGKLFTVLLVLGSGFMSAQLTSISQGWQLVLNIGFGTGAVYILRWYWSRINAWSEIVAMAVAAGHYDFAEPGFHFGKQRGGIREDRYHHHGHHHRSLADCDLCDQSGVRPKAAVVLPARASQRVWLAQNRQTGAGHAGSAGCGQ